MYLLKEIIAQHPRFVKTKNCTKRKSADRIITHGKRHFDKYEITGGTVCRI